MANGLSRRAVLSACGGTLAGVVGSLEGSDVASGRGHAAPATAELPPGGSGGDGWQDRVDGGPAEQATAPSSGSGPAESGTEASGSGGSGEPDWNDADGSRRSARPENGAVVIVYDDGPIEDYTQALPAHREFDVPAVSGVVTEWIGREDHLGTDWMTLSQLEELADAGWEIASHTTDHTAVGTAALRADAAPGDARLYPDHVRHGFHGGLTVEVADGDRIVRESVAGHGSDGDGAYVELEGTLGEAFPAGSALRYPPEQVRMTVAESKGELEALGFDVETFLAPYDVFDDYSRPFVAERYGGVVNARPGSPINDPEGFDPLRTRRDYFIEYTTPEAVRGRLDEVADRGALGVIGAHTFKPEVTTERIRETLGWIDERDIEVLTMREACETYADGR